MEFEEISSVSHPARVVLKAMMDDMEEIVPFMATLERPRRVIGLEFAGRPQTWLLAVQGRISGRDTLRAGKNKAVTLPKRRALQYNVRVKRRDCRVA